MTRISKGDVYRKAAEIIVRDGMHQGGLVERRTLNEADEETIKDTSRKVCALGACARAEHELYGTLPLDEDCGDLNPYEPYAFLTAHEGHRRSIHDINDWPGTSAEDIALLLKRQAEKVDE